MSAKPETMVEAYVDGKKDSVKIQRKYLNFPRRPALDFDIHVDPNFTYGDYVASFYEPGKPKDAPHVAHLSNDNVNCRGILLAVKQVVEAYQEQDLILYISDLNLCRALSQVASGKADIRLDERLMKSFDLTSKAITKHKGKIISCFPFRIGYSPGRSACRISSVLEGTFHIYPCPGMYANWIEVRFVHDGKSCHEVMPDFGVSGVTLYASNAVALGDHDRLHPDVMAHVEPNQFWRSILFYKKFMSALATLDLPKVIMDEWREMHHGIVTQRKQLDKISKFCGQNLPPKNGLWKEVLSGIDEEYDDLAFASFQAGLIMTLGESVSSEPRAQVEHELFPLYRRGAQLYEGGRYQETFDFHCEKVSGCTCNAGLVSK